MNDKKRASDRAAVRTLTRRINVQGLSCLDQRTVGYRELVARRNALIEALGGDVSPQKREIIEETCRLLLIRDSSYAVLLELPSPVNKRKKRMVPLVRDILSLDAEIRSHVTLLGLERVPKLVSAIDDDRMQKILAVEAEVAQQEKEHESEELDPEHS